MIKKMRPKAHPTEGSKRERERERGKTQAVMHLNLGTIGTLFQGKSLLHPGQPLVHPSLKKKNKGCIRDTQGDSK